MSKSRKNLRKRYKDDNCNLLNAKPYSGRNTKRNFDRLKYIIALHELLRDQDQKRIDKLEKQLAETCEQACKTIEYYKESLKKVEKSNAGLSEIIMEFGDYHEFNDFMYQSTHLKMHLNTNHRIN